ncbi:MAG: hypothetical protein P0Y49_20595 [Candidatus Pedobacter colombiensis]|uniref:Uncharacterized protein n=1 Tax=Candidatus Pedobacter colombiensis TaxID=3121371 RepID=A0AAJ5W8J9_9SPHI|nr:hypothetical protein [Pedobacter sp.]WEK19181.1 MAG: hypothetical protein P0Y49_20595 [Pedobacter sp.]
MIHLIITTANIENHYQERKWLYIQSIERALQFDYLFDSYTILECASSDEDYLNEHNVHYSNVQNKYPEKGLNEMQHLKAFIEHASFDENDLIIKLTGRYMLEDNSFFNKVRLLASDYDSIFKDDSDIYEGVGYHTFLYCAKKSRFLEIINSLNYSKENLDPIEWGVKNYLKGKERHYEIARLGIKAYQGTYGENVFSC